MSVPGPLRFARYAYPPNALGYCGPEDARALLEYADAGVVDGGLRDLAARFEGAWPYLELIAHAHGLPDPLDDRVVEAYWIGNEMLDRVGPTHLGESLEARFRSPAGRAWPDLAAAVEWAPRPHHGFHVFVVYPWVGLLRTGATDHALHVLDRCRIRWGRVRSVSGEHAVVESRPLTWDGHRLGLGPRRAESVVLGRDGYHLDRVAPGDVVSLHWDWVCERLTPAAAAALRRETAWTLLLVNRRLAYPPPAAVLS